MAGEIPERVVFRDNGHTLLQIKDLEQREGFLEFRVRPVFNLKRMGLGDESRDLGIQVSGGDLDLVQFPAVRLVAQAAGARRIFSPRASSPRSATRL